MYIFHSRPVAKQARVTLVIKYVDGIVSIAASRCSAKDNFSRKKGRQIAEGRLVKGKLVDSFEKKDSMSNVEFLNYANYYAEMVVNDSTKVH